MLRQSVLFLAAAVAACAEPPPQVADGELVAAAVDRAQARIEPKPRARRAAAPVREGAW